MMKRIALAIAAVALVGFGAQSALAGDDHHQHGSHGHGDYYRYQRDHERLQDHLEHRAFHRELQHREAHRHPMTWQQEERLHKRLERQEFRDIMKHENFHEKAEHRYRPAYPQPHYNPHPAPRPTGGFGVQGRNMSFWIGY